MRKVDVVRPTISYAVVGKWDPNFQVAWFLLEEDAIEFWEIMSQGIKYEIAEVRR